jgi:FkbM family methyltransferase
MICCAGSKSGGWRWISDADRTCGSLRLAWLTQSAAKAHATLHFPQCPRQWQDRIGQPSGREWPMPMVSYSQNLEDVILTRAFRYVQTGCYVDVGASLPDKESLSYAFYRRGWRGICIEPQPYADEWKTLRPNDLFINAAVGEQPGSLDLHVYDKLKEVSTGSADSIAHWKQFGFQSDRQIRVPILTLNQILTEHLRGRTVHFMSIDVEGMEREVLNGLDLAKYRPWIMIVEATVPGTPVSCSDKWESMILDRGYRMVYWDGLNRFYLCNEMDSLLPNFAAPPNVWDDYVPAAHVAQQERIVALEAKVGQLTEELARRSKK